MNDVFKEVEESLREETIGRWWKRWSPLVYGAIAAAVIGVGVYEFMRSQRADAINRAAMTYDAGFVALQSGDLPTARARFSELSKSDTGFAVLAGNMLARVERDLTNDPAAIEGYLKAAAATDKGVLGDLSILKLGYLKADTSTLPELQAALKPLVDKEGQVSLLAREIIAAKMLATGDVNGARDQFESLSVDLNSPQAMRQRVQQVLATLPARAVNLDAPAAAPATTTTPAVTPAITPAPAAPTGQPQQ
ncbi:MAG: tetratricopeptide repeat protein [Hyphomonadaceae bacterium]